MDSKKFKAAIMRTVSTGALIRAFSGIGGIPVAAPVKQDETKTQLANPESAESNLPKEKTATVSQ